MARDSEFQRERKKKQLRQSMVTNDKVRSAPVSWAEDHKRTVNVAGIVVAVLVLAVVLAWFVAERLWRYKTYEVSWRTDVSNASSAGYVSYGDGIVVMNLVPLPLKFPAYCFRFLLMMLHLIPHFLMLRCCL